MKTAVLGLFTSMLLIGIGGTAQASGFRCESDNLRDGYVVKLYNHTRSTRLPATLVISRNLDGTLLVRKGSEIRKQARGLVVRYVVEGNRKIDADQVVLQIAFREGLEVLAAGKTVKGQLILVKDGGKIVSELTCKRYLKSR